MKAYIQIDAEVMSKVLDTLEDAITYGNAHEACSVTRALLVEAMSGAAVAIEATTDGAPANV